MGSYYSIFDNDEVYSNKFNDLSIDGSRPRHAFDVPVPEDDLSPRSIHIYKDFGYDILSSYP